MLNEYSMKVWNRYDNSNRLGLVVHCVVRIGSHKLRAPAGQKLEMGENTCENTWTRSVVKSTKYCFSSDAFLCEYRRL